MAHADVALICHHVGGVAVSLIKQPRAIRMGLTHSHARAPKQEKTAAKRIGGKLVAGSGAGAIKGDVRARGVVRLENKCTKHSSFSVTQHMIDQIEEAAVSTGELPCIQVEFLNERGVVTRRVNVVPDWVLEDLVAYGLARKSGATGDTSPDAGSPASSDSPDSADDADATGSGQHPRIRTRLP